MYNNIQEDSVRYADKSTNKNSISPMSIKMMKDICFDQRLNQITYFGMNVQLIACIARVLNVKFDDNNNIKITVTICDDTDSINLTYYNKADDKQQGQKLYEIDNADYYKFFLYPKTYGNRIYFVIQNYQYSRFYKIYLTQRIIQTIQLISTRKQSFFSLKLKNNNNKKFYFIINFKQLHDMTNITNFTITNQPLDVQIQVYFKKNPNKPITISQLFTIFQQKNVTIQHLKLIIDQLKKKREIIECLMPDTYMSL